MSLALAEAARLKPPVRLSRAITNFASVVSLDSNGRVRFESLSSQGYPGSEDVIRLTEEINRDGARRHRSWRPFGTRLVAILEKIRVFSKVGDILVGGSQNMIASGVWAIVRLSLETAISHVSYFEKVSALLMKLGRTATANQDIASLFQNSKELQDYVCEYLIVVVQICQKILLFDQKSSLSQLLAATSSSFESEFKPLEESLDVWSRHIDDRLKFLTAQSQLVSERTIVQTSQAFEFFRSHEARRRNFEDRRIQLLSRLSPYQNDFDKGWRRHRKRGSVRWVLEESSYHEWKSPGSTSNTLWVSGPLGSGKSVLLATIVGDLYSESANPAAATKELQPIVASIFCQYNRPKTLDSENIIGSVFHQFVKGLDDTSAANLINSYPVVQGSHGLVKLLAELLPSDRCYYIVIDALDECETEDALEVLEELMELADTLSVRICWSSRTDSALISIAEELQLFPRLIRVSMASSQRLVELQSYIDAEVDKRSASYSISPEIRTLVKNALHAGAQGMYLWVSLQIELLFPRHGTERLDPDILRMLETLPRGLEESYDRALRKIDEPSKGSKLFQIIAGACRPLLLSELSICLNVDIGDTYWNPSTAVQHPQAMVELWSGGLLEIEEEDQSVHFIHYSALQHLRALPSTSPLSDLFGFGVMEADVLMGMICVTYLNYECHQKQVALRPAHHFDATVASNKIMASALHHGGSIAWIMKALSERPSRQPRKVNVARLLGNYVPSPAREQDITDFLEYGAEFWLYHTSLFPRGIDTRCVNLFAKVLFDTPPHLAGSWEGENDRNNAAILWALKNAHLGIIRTIMDLQKADRHVLTAIVNLCQTTSIPLRGQQLEDIIARCLVHDVNDLDSIRVLLELEADPNIPYQPSQDARPVYPLLWAIRGSYHCHVTQFLEFGATVHVKDNEDSVLQAAMKSGNELTVKLLLAHEEIDVNERTATGELPIQYAASNGLAAIARVLLDHGAPPVIFTDKHQSLAKIDAQPLILAFKSNSLPIVRHILHDMGNLETLPRKFVSAALSAAAGSEVIDGDIIDSFIRLGADVSWVTNPHVLMGAVAAGHDDLAEHFIKRIPYPRNQVYQGKSNTWLSSNGNAIHLVHGETPLQAAARNRSKMMLTCLFAFGVETKSLPVGDDSLSALQIAISIPDYDIVGLLLSHGVSPNATAPGTDDPVTMAVKALNPYLVRLLVSYGADVKNTKEALQFHDSKTSGIEKRALASTMKDIAKIINIAKQRDAPNEATKPPLRDLSGRGIWKRTEISFSRDWFPRGPRIEPWGRWALGFGGGGKSEPTFNDPASNAFRTYAVQTMVPESEDSAALNTASFNPNANGNELSIVQEALAAKAAVSQGGPSAETSLINAVFQPELKVRI